jgi:hypothetical protein
MLACPQDEGALLTEGCLPISPFPVSPFPGHFTNFPFRQFLILPVSHFPFCQFPISPICQFPISPFSHFVNILFCFNPLHKIDHSILEKNE